jgi:hypothetical protein
MFFQEKINEFDKTLAKKLEDELNAFRMKVI